jgi:hypothetical protein
MLLGRDKVSIVAGKWIISEMMPPGAIEIRCNTICMSGNMT